MSEFSPFETLTRFTQRWWWLVIATVLGGLIGWIASSIIKPVYEAGAELYVNINEAQYAVDHDLQAVDSLEREVAMYPVSDFLYESDVINGVAAQAKSQGIALDADHFVKEFFLSRIYTRWLLIVRRDNPQEAAVLANAWADATLNALNAAYTHAVTAHAIQLELLAFNACFKEQDFATANTCAQTSFATRADFESYLNDLTARYNTEQTAAHNLDYNLSFRLEHPATTPAEPSLYRTPWLILAGTFIGFIAGIFVAGIPARTLGQK
jgi:capsular polysaccharide biosynthesis protein